jgi:hypothetical protein
MKLNNNQQEKFFVVATYRTSIHFFNLGSVFIHFSFAIKISFRSRYFVLLIGILSFQVPLSSPKTIKCSFKSVEFVNLNRSFVTCSVENQPINDISSTLASFDPSSVSKTKGFNIDVAPLVEFIPQRLSEKFPNLIAVQIRYTSVKSVLKNHLKDLRNLKFLNLEHNKIVSIDSSAFEDNEKLERIDLQSNKIEYLNAGIFSPLLSLRILYLCENQISFFDPVSLKNLTNLEKFYMRGNKIKYLEAGTFSNLQNLKEIVLVDNKLVSIDTEMFSDLINHKVLNKVDLRGNECIDAHFAAKQVSSMITEIKEKCLSIEALRGKSREWIQEKENLISEVKSLESKNQLNQENSDKRIDEITTRAENLKMSLDSCKRLLRK